MSEAASSPESPRARSFGPVADAYDRARPGYPADAVRWLVGTTGPAFVVELGAGTGKLTEELERAGHEVVATDPLPDMLSRLRERAGTQPVVATAECIPLPSGSVDVVVCGQSFHWFAHEVALPEIARVLRPGGHVALAWNYYDVAIPWVRRLRELLMPGFDSPEDAATPLMETPYFGFVDTKRFRFWQPHTAASLADLARSASRVATMDEHDRARVLRQVAELYDGYGRGHDGMQVPYLTHCFRAVVRHEALPPEEPVPLRPAAGGAVQLPEHTKDTGPVIPRKPPEDPGVQLIDFR